MESFFSYKFAEAFEMFSPIHWIVLALIAVMVLLVIGFRQKLREPAWNKTVRYALIVGLIGMEFILQLWMIVEGQWEAQYSLPVHLCTISVILSAAMLFTGNRFLFECICLVGACGALQALVTPDLDFSFPHIRFFLFFISHAAIILACIFMIAVERYRPRFKSLLVVFVALNAYAAVVFIINVVTGGNYMFLARKPAGGSLLDVLGPWPWYIVSLEGVTVAFMLLVYAPFGIVHLRSRRKNRRNSDN